jgi:hypothetical protein
MASLHPMLSVLLLALPALVAPLYFHIGETERKCFIEEIPDETMVIGKRPEEEGGRDRGR